MTSPLPRDASARMARTDMRSDDDTMPAPDFHGCGDIGKGHSVAELMKSVLRSMSQAVDRRLAAHGLTNAQWIPLLPLAEGRCSSIVELARFCGSDAGAMTRTIDRLEAKGLLQRLRSSKDRRMIRLELTDAGRVVAALVPGVVSDVLNRHLAGFTMHEWECLQDLLRRMQANGRGPAAGRAPASRDEPARRSQGAGGSPVDG